jgi:pilus assembly protein Flp/PilA
MGKNMKNYINKFIRDEAGATAIEYGLIAALIGVVIIVAVTKVGSQLSAKFGKVADTLATVN